MTEVIIDSENREQVKALVLAIDAVADWHLAGWGEDDTEVLNESIDSVQEALRNYVEPVTTETILTKYMDEYDAAWVANELREAGLLND